MTIPAGLRRFSRTIVTKRDGRCYFCQQPTTTGVDYAAVNASGAWTSVCVSCSATLAAQAAGLVTSINAAAEGHDVDEDAILMPTTENLLATLQGTAGEALAYDTILALITARDMVLQQFLDSVAPLACIPGLRAIAADATAKPRDRDFALSLVSQYDRKGSLSERQVAAAEQMISRSGSGAVAAPGALENGLYLHDNGRIYKLYTTQNGRQGAKVLQVEASHGSFQYLAGGTRLVAQAVADGFAHALTQDEAQAFGRLHGFCCNCAKDLDDDRSLAVGYGPVCAGHFGWFYPNYAEAAKLLGRPVSTPAGVVHQP